MNANLILKNSKQFLMKHSRNKNILPVGVPKKKSAAHSRRM